MCEQRREHAGIFLFIIWTVTSSQTVVSRNFQHFGPSCPFKVQLQLHEWIRPFVPVLLPQFVSGLALRHRSNAPRARRSAKRVRAKFQKFRWETSELVRPRRESRVATTCRRQTQTSEKRTVADSSPPRNHSSPESGTTVPVTTCWTQLLTTTPLCSERIQRPGPPPMTWWRVEKHVGRACNSFLPFLSVFYEAEPRYRTRCHSAPGVVEQTGGFQPLPRTGAAGGLTVISVVDARGDSSQGLSCVAFKVAS